MRIATQHSPRCLAPSACLNCLSAQLPFGTRVRSVRQERGHVPVSIAFRLNCPLGPRQKITRYRTGYHKFDGCPLAAIGYMMDIYAAIRKILKNSRKELEKERNKKEKDR